MGGVVPDHHEGVDVLVLGLHELEEGGEGGVLDVFASEEGLVEEPLVEEDLEADAVVVGGLGEEANDGLEVGVDEAGVDDDEGLDD